MRQPRVLVTGFGPFLDNAVNPSESLARELDGQNLEGTTFIALAPLPVAYATAADIVAARAATLDVGAILLLGLASTSPQIRVETTGRNVSTCAHPDARGVKKLGEVTIPGEPAQLSTRLDAKRVVATLLQNGVDARVSDDAGGYVCNDVYFRTLSGERMSGERPCLFVHVPPGAEQQPGLALMLGRAFLSGFTSRT